MRLIKAEVNIGNGWIPKLRKQADIAYHFSVARDRKEKQEFKKQIMTIINNKNIIGPEDIEVEIT